MRPTGGRQVRRHDLQQRARERDEEPKAEPIGPPRLEHQGDAGAHADERQRVDESKGSSRLHCFTVPNVTPRSRCLRTSTVNTAIGATNKIAPAATCGHGMPSISPCSPAK